MDIYETTLNNLAQFSRVTLSQTPTPLEKLTHLSEDFVPYTLYVKRDDCTGLAMGGNKARQLEFYLGEAIAAGCDSVVGTGAVQSNQIRMLAAAAAKLELECHVQIEACVDNYSADYQHGGNVLLGQLFGTHVHRYLGGNDEDSIDQSLIRRAELLTKQGKKPYIIPFGSAHNPIGALGYVAAAIELAQQIEHAELSIDMIAIGSGSGISHAGLLTGLRMLGVNIPVLGVCVKRTADLQHLRVLRHCQKLADMLGNSQVVTAAEVQVDDATLVPGYGRASRQVMRDLHLLARREGLLADPTYSGKTFSCVFDRIRKGGCEKNIIIVHTGGIPGLFAHRNEVLDENN